MRDVYQRLYSGSNYGSAEHDMCPGVRYLPLYLHYLEGIVVDFGCGNGDTRRAIENSGYPEICIGIDWIDKELGEGWMSADITKEICLPEGRQYTGICIDVFEHIDDEGLEGLCKNLQQCDGQVISVFSGSHIVDGIELHINQKTIEQWEEYIDKRFDIIRGIPIPDAPNRMIFLTTSR